MQHQPPHLNNPANPLLKVAALRLDKEYIALRPNRKVRVVATLNFKRSHDMRGLAKSISGDDVTVSFSLALRRASLEMSFSFDPDSNQNIKIEKIAHSSPLEVKDKITKQSAIAKQSKGNAGWSAPIKLGVGETGLWGAASVQTGASRQAASMSSNTESVTRTMKKNNIAVTFGGRQLHWELNAAAGLESPHKIDRPEILEGELFQTTAKGERIDACVVSWQATDDSSLVISGSVFTLMQDMDVGEIRFLTSEGGDFPWKQVDQKELTKVNLGGLGMSFLTHSAQKERLMKQIIRKHLVSQGMVTEGARVQICKAYT